MINLFFTVDFILKISLKTDHAMLQLLFCFTSMTFSIEKHVCIKSLPSGCSSVAIGSALLFFNEWVSSLVLNQACTAVIEVWGPF
jgi:hypothetical protein